VPLNGVKSSQKRPLRYQGTEEGIQGDEVILKQKYFLIPTSLALECVEWAEWRFQNWVAPFGPVENWPQVLRATQLAAEDSEDRSRWCLQLQEAIAEGQELVSSVHKVAILELPKDGGDIRDVWCRAFRIMGSLLTGLAYLQCVTLFEFSTQSET
jgi:hypothetical protein